MLNVNVLNSKKTLKLNVRHRLHVVLHQPVKPSTKHGMLFERKSLMSQGNTLRLATLDFGTS